MAEVCFYVSIPRFNLAHSKKLSGVRLLPQKQQVILAASMPLTDEVWIPLDEREIIVMQDGKLIERTPDPSSI